MSFWNKFRRTWLILYSQYFFLDKKVFKKSRLRFSTVNLHLISWKWLNDSFHSLIISNITFRWIDSRLLIGRPFYLKKCCERLLKFLDTSVWQITGKNNDAILKRVQEDSWIKHLGMTNRKIFYKEKMEVTAEIDSFVITAY